MSSKNPSLSRSVGQYSVDFDLHKRLQRCWEEDINWKNIPTKIKDVRDMFTVYKDLFIFTLLGLGGNRIML